MSSLISAGDLMEPSSSVCLAGSSHVDDYLREKSWNNNMHTSPDLLNYGHTLPLSDRKLESSTIDGIKEKSGDIESWVNAEELPRQLGSSARSQPRETESASHGMNNVIINLDKALKFDKGTADIPFINLSENVLDELRNKSNILADTRVKATETVSADSVEVKKQTRKSTKRRDSASTGTVRANKDGTVVWQKVGTTDGSAKASGAVARQAGVGVADKPGRRLRKKREKSLTSMVLDNDQRSVRGTCSICGQDMEAGAKTVCKGCMGRQKAGLTLCEKQGGGKTFTGQSLKNSLSKTEDLGSPSASSTNVSLISNDPNVNFEISPGEAYDASMGHVDDQARYGSLQHIPTEVESQKSRSNGQQRFADLTYWDGNKGKDNSSQDSQAPSTASQNSECDDSSSQESLSRNFQHLDTSREGSQSDVSQSEIYTSCRSENKGVDIENEHHVDDSTDPADQRQHDGQIYADLVDQRGRLQRAKTDSEIVRGAPEQEEGDEEAKLEQDGVSNTRSQKIPGKPLKRKTSSQSMDAGRGTYSTLGTTHKKDARGKRDKITYGDDRGDSGKSFSKGKGHGYKSRVEGSTVATFRAPSDKERILGERKRSMDYSDSTAKTSSTSLSMEKPGGKKPFANLRSHTIIGGNMHRHKESLLKKEKKKEEEVQTQVEILPVVQSNTSDALTTDSVARSSTDMTLYEIIEESDDSCDESVSEGIKKGNENDASASIEVKKNLGTPGIMRHSALKPVGGLRSGAITSFPSNLHEKSTRFDEGLRVRFRDYPNGENSDSNDENSRPFQESQELLNSEEDAKEIAQPESAPSLSPETSSDDIYYDKGDGESDTVAAIETLSHDIHGLAVESPYHASLLRYSNPHIENDDRQDETAQNTLQIVQTPTAQNATEYDETDVDTGITTIARRTQKSSSPVRQTKISHVDVWGQPINSPSNSSIESGQEANEGTGSSWYTGGFFNFDNNLANASDSSDSVYFEGKPEDANSDSSDHDIYTGQVYSVAFSNHLSESEGNKTLNNNFIPSESIVQNNSKNNSVRQQMHRLHRRPKNQVSLQSIIDHDVSWTEGQGLKVGHLLPTLCPSPCNYSNNYNGKESDYDGPSHHACGKSSDNDTVASIPSSCYTDYDNDFTKDIDIARAPTITRDYTNLISPESEFEGFAASNFQESNSMQSFIKDVLFFEDSSETNFASAFPPQEQGMYFKNMTLPQVETCNNGQFSLHQESPRDEDEDYYDLSPSWTDDKHNHNNNSSDSDDRQNNRSPFEDWYTGSRRNEEEYKPAFEEEFNTTPVVWPMNLPKTKSWRDGEYFYENVNEIKPYVSEEDSDYACEQKVRKQQMRKSLSPKVTQLFKVGGIVIRNNVQDDTDYAKNINMDLQEEPRPYVRYDKSEHNSNEVSDDTCYDTYEKNVVYDDFTTSRPWEEDDRAPWRVSRGQISGFNMEKALKGAYNIKKDSGKSCHDKTSWVTPNGTAPGVVKYLGSYVTRWF